MVLQETQQLGLRRQGQGANFIQEQGAAFGLLDQPLVAAPGAGEGLRFMAKQLIFHQLPRQRAAIDRHKPPARPKPIAVDRLGEYILAGPGLPHNQHRRVGTREAPGLRDLGADDRAPAHNFAQAEFSAQHPLRQLRFAGASQRLHNSRLHIHNPTLSA